MKEYKNQNGFLLISLVLAVAIIAILVAIYYGGGKEKQSSQIKTGQQAIEDTKENNAIMQNQQIEIQHQLNSIDK